ncbi:MAG: YwiC-like family protein [Propionibacteriaceae bacterium]|nr:YwiC-like family protein [Propionibacteriaceae bacterium]
MMIAPVLAGGIIAGYQWFHAVLLGAWVIAYLGFMAVRGWLRPRGGLNYRVPTLTYGALAALCVGVLVVWRPAFWWWAIPLAVLLGTSLLLIVTGKERTVLNDGLLIGASALMTVIAATASRLSSMGWSAFIDTAAVPGAWLVAAVYAGYFWGTIFYVKTMIRERGKLRWYVISVVYHAFLVIPGFLVNLWIGLVSVLILIRAILVPRLWPRTKPKWIGFGEIAITIIVTIIVSCTLRL